MYILSNTHMNTTDNHSETSLSESSRADLKSAFASYLENVNNVYVFASRFRDGHFSLPFFAFSPRLACKCYLEYANLSPVMFEGSELICVGVYDTSTGIFTPEKISVGTLVEIIKDDNNE